MISFAAVLMSLALSPPQASLQPRLVPPPPINPIVTPAPPDLDAASWALFSVDREAEILAVNADEQRAMASVTKVMTAIVVVENAQPNEQVTISANAARTPIGYTGQPEVLQGEVWTVEELLANLMVQSGNDAAAALAEHVGGSVEGFVDLMNQKAAALGKRSTAFASPSGLDAALHFSSSRDLIKLGLAAVDIDRITSLTSIKSITFASGRRVITVTNTNRLLGVFPGVAGLKTGDTLNAGRTLLGYQHIGSRRTLSAVMGTQQHYAVTAELLAYSMTTLGPGDHLAAAAIGTPVAGAIPEWLVPRLEAVGDLPTGQGSLSPPGSTPGQQRVVAAFRDLLPPLLGGDE